METKKKTLEDVLGQIEAYDNLIARTNSLVRSIKVYPKLLTKPEHQHLHKLMNKLLYNTLVQLDLIIAIKYMDVSYSVPNELETNYFARIIAHNSYEILKNLHKLSDKETRQIIEEKLGKEELAKIDSNIKELNQIYKTHGEMLKNIRHNLFGHRHEDALLQTELILKMDIQVIFTIGNDVFKIQHKLIRELVDLLEKI